MTVRRYETLDGLRGVAAILVVAHHSSELFTGTYLPESGYLAVDFFFMLSGFVLAAVYEPRFAAGLTPWQFSRVRVRTLYPTMALGIVLGAAVRWYAGPEGMLAVLTVAAFLFIPIVFGQWGLYPLNGVQWSLAFEFLLNALHVALLWRLSNRSLASLCGLFFVTLVATGIDYGDLMVGDQGSDLAGGLARALFPYTLGILLFRLREHLPAMRLPSWAFLLSFAVVIFGADATKLTAAPWLVDLVFVVMLCPPLIHLGSLASGLTRTCRMLGSLSFPLYAIHLPLLYALATTGASGVGMALIGIGFTTVAAYGLVNLAMLKVGNRRGRTVPASDADAKGVTGAEIGV